MRVSLLNSTLFVAFKREGHASTQFFFFFYLNAFIISKHKLHVDHGRNRNVMKYVSENISIIYYSVSKIEDLV